jgi:heme oxygenase
MQKLKKIASAPKKIASHVYYRRGRYGFAVGTIAGGYIIRNLDNETYKEAMAFIKLKGLDDEFFNPQEHDWQDMV